MKKFGSLLLILVLLFTLSACNSTGGDKDDPNLGVWHAVSASMAGINMDVADIFEKGVTLELKGNGKFDMTVEGESAGGKWAYDGDALKLTADGIEMTCVVENGMLILTDLLGAGVDLTFEKEGGYNGATGEGDGQ